MNDDILLNHLIFPISTHVLNVKESKKMNLQNDNSVRFLPQMNESEIETLLVRQWSGYNRLLENKNIHIYIYKHVYAFMKSKEDEELKNFNFPYEQMPCHSWQSRMTPWTARLWHDGVSACSSKYSTTNILMFHPYFDKSKYDVAAIPRWHTYPPFGPDILMLPCKNHYCTISIVRSSLKSNNSSNNNK